MKLMVIPIVSGVLWTVRQSLEKRVKEKKISEGMDIFETTELFKPVWILSRILDPEESCRHSVNQLPLV